MHQLLHQLPHKEILLVITVHPHSAKQHLLFVPFTPKHLACKKHCPNPAPLFFQPLSANSASQPTHQVGITSIWQQACSKAHEALICILLAWCVPSCNHIHLFCQMRSLCFSFTILYCVFVSQGGIFLPFSCTQRARKWQTQKHLEQLVRPEQHCAITSFTVHGAWKAPSFPNKLCVFMYSISVWAVCHHPTHSHMANLLLLIIQPEPSFELTYTVR